MWHDHPFSQRNNATERAEEEGLGKKLKKNKVGNIGIAGVGGARGGARGGLNNVGGLELLSPVVKIIHYSLAHLTKMSNHVTLWQNRFTSGPCQTGTLPYWWRCAVC